MNWDAIGAIGEIIGALAVVATLFYLAFQIRQNTKVTRADMTKDLLLASRSAILEISSNPLLTKTYTQIRDFDDPDITSRYTFYASFFRLYELQFSLSGQGFLDENIIQSYKLIIKMFVATKYFEEYWVVAQHEFHEDFANYVNEQRRAIASDA